MANNTAYGKLNKDVILEQYKGLTSNNIIVETNLDKRTIKADLKERDIKDYFNEKVNGQIFNKLKVDKYGLITEGTNLKYTLDDLDLNDSELGLDNRYLKLKDLITQQVDSSLNIVGDITVQGSITVLDDQNIKDDFNLVSAKDLLVLRYGNEDGLSGERKTQEQKQEFLTKIEEAYNNLVTSTWEPDLKYIESQIIKVKSFIEAYKIYEYDISKFEDDEGNIPDLPKLYELYIYLKTGIEELEDKLYNSFKKPTQTQLTQYYEDFKEYINTADYSYVPPPVQGTPDKPFIEDDLQNDKPMYAINKLLVEKNIKRFTKLINCLNINRYYGQNREALVNILLELNNQSIDYLTNDYSGLKIENYDGKDNSLLIAVDNEGVARLGEGTWTSPTKPLAVREEIEYLQTKDNFVYWDDSSWLLKTRYVTPTDINQGLLNEEPNYYPTAGLDFSRDYMKLLTENKNFVTKDYVDRETSYRGTYRVIGQNREVKELKNLLPYKGLRVFIQEGATI